jgi:hypothetical protein
VISSRKTLVPISVGIVVSPNDSADLLRVSLNSLLNQTIGFERTLILINGELSKEQLRIIQEYKALSESGTIIEREILTINFGPALNKLINLTGTEFFMRHDPDDISIPDRTKIMYEIISKSNLDITYTNIYEYNFVTGSVGQRLISDKEVNLTNDLIYRNPIAHSTVVFRTKNIAGLGGYRDVYLAEDYDLWLRAIEFKLKFQEVKVASVIYHVDNRKRNRSLTKLFRTEITLFRTKSSIWPKSKVKLILVTLQRLTFYILPIFVQKLIINFLSKTSFSFIGKQKIEDLIAMQIKGPIT